jgi:type II secretory pathway pseudopilin PulG
MNSASFSRRNAGARRLSGKRAFTLVETMVATVLLSMIILSILAVLIGSYRVAAKARYNDHARYVVKSIADQFLTQQMTDSTTGATFTLFVPNGTSGPDGTGMSWTNYDGSLGFNTAQGMHVLLGGDTGAPIDAYVTRTVWWLFASGGSMGTPTMTPQNGSAGYLIRGDFTITYTWPEQSSQAATYTQTVSAVRSYP